MSEAAPAVGGQGVVTDAAPTVSPVIGSGAFTEQNNGTPGQVSSGYEWLQGADELTVGFAQNKGWDSPIKALDSYRNLEKLLGADKANNAVILPKSAEDAASWNALYDRLGRPSDPNGYGFKSETGDQTFDTALSSKFHELGLSKEQGQKFGQWLNESMAQGKQVEAAKQAQVFAQDQSALQQEWGAAYTQNLAAAQVAARALGMDGDTIDKIAGAIGHKATMTMLSRIGAGYEEDGFVTGDAPSGFGNAMTPGQAKSEIQSLMSDSDFMKAYLGGNTDARNKMQRLHQFAYPE